IAETTMQITRSFRRNDTRIRTRITSKYGQRRKRRMTQILHQISKEIVQNAKCSGVGIVFEDIRYIRRLYRKGNGDAVVQEENEWLVVW
ncbi:MAG TPA: hypothetical protein VEI80_06700, partial [Candidatus Acidoferrales bacterium]|nr:hypothetical protein [Candidatus Acidoferrales bacterium]